ncbi:hypothetical protein [Vallitalea guaymasensis]|uniref:hypothetical protein n=1 Tax=Vallitalea guaymasensis TaxID=1185412 RepID=UPI000DE31E45|nr:hypothetical protein [Vallitalea guaymasensis]
MNVKDLFESDSNAIFNIDELAENKEIYYDGKSYTLPVIIDYEGAEDRKKRSSDNADGIYLVDAKLYMLYSDFGCMPRKDAQIEFDDNIFKINKAENDGGEIILHLERFDE